MKYITQKTWNAVQHINYPKVRCDAVQKTAGLESLVQTVGFALNNATKITSSPFLKHSNSYKKNNLDIPKSKIAK